MLAIPEYTPDELRILAYQSATSSGKTLLMHAHIRQYRHYLDRAGGRLNNIVLLTPNKQMSEQHEREFRASGSVHACFRAAPERTCSNRSRSSREVKILMRLPDGRNVAARQAVHGSPSAMATTNTGLACS